MDGMEGGAGGGGETGETGEEAGSNCAENIRKHILHTGKHEGVKMYNCPKCDAATNSPADFRNHLKELHPDIENPDLAYLHAAPGAEGPRAGQRGGGGGGGAVVHRGEPRSPSQMQGSP
ncbi:hypothetical protein CRUP_014192, partial [Coryphaenoides rupestris]